MAFIDKSSGLRFTGPLGEFSVYKMRGCDRPVVRLKGGPKAERIKSGPEFKNLRKNNKEFGGCSAASKYVRHLFHSHRTGTLTGVHGGLTARLMTIRELDTVSEWGKRHVLISKNPQSLEGYPLNKNPLFDVVVTSPLSCSVSRADFSARVEIPEIIPGVNLFLPEDQPVYRLVAMLMLVPDFFHDGKKHYKPATGVPLNISSHAETEWCSAMDGSPATTLDLKLQTPSLPENQNFTLVLCVGIHEGTVQRGMMAKQMIKGGAAKILATA